MNSIFGIDIGGTEIKIGKFYDKKLVLKTSIKTDITDHGKNIFADIFDKIDELNNGDNLSGIGVGVPGPVVRGVVNGAQNLGWGKIAAEEIIKRRYPKINIRVLNDANAAAIGEMAKGAARKFQDFVLLTLGTGIGGCVVINGEVLEGHVGAAGEIGHIRISLDEKRLCNCGLYDCHERYSSATGLVLTALELMKGRKTRLHDVELNAKNIFNLAKDNDEVALTVVNMMLDTLAQTLANVAAVVNPEAFIIGGGVSKAGDFLLENLEKKFKKLCFFALKDTKFALAELGNDAGIYGAAYAVR